MNSPKNTFQKNKSHSFFFIKNIFFRSVFPLPFRNVQINHLKMLRTCFVNHVRNRGRVSLVRPAKLTVNSLTQETEPTKKLSRGDLFQTYDSDAIVAQELSRGSELVKLDPHRASELEHNKSDAHTLSRVIHEPAFRFMSI